MQALISFLFFWLGLTCFVTAHPVTYKGGFATSAIQTRNDTTVYLNHSISQKKSYGVQFISLSDTNERLLFLTSNRLLKRWYFFDAQANIYTTTSLGYNIDDKTITPCIFTKIDAENRYFYTDLTLTLMKPNTRIYSKLTTRIGGAPYKHTYSSISAWFMIEATYISYDSSTVFLMPIYRGFYKTYLWELGYNGKHFLAHIMVHF
tara:strand:+ start:241 stop:855 length:615 start_codon:yes stop_codon:yes gene_type:complete